ncbi:MAG TPA: orotidine-5'-phosphate decarboxylase [Longimicrobiales bacterium]|nr:orotidine-5'-phosphate decarboxylase [Longimicrobiales bacterium]
MADLIIALDRSDDAQALDLVDRLGDAVDFYKVGAELFTSSGPSVVRALRDRGKRVFLDLKYHDIPNTVASAVVAARDLGVDLLTVHAAGGDGMLRAAAEAAGDDGPVIVAVTLLTSLSSSDVEQVWGRSVPSLRGEVDRLAALALACGLQGVVASALEVEALKRRHGSGFVVVTPGIRPAGAAADDQSRTATAGDAARAGADYLVVGRPVHEASDPLAVVLALRDELSLATGVA